MKIEKLAAHGHVWTPHPFSSDDTPELAMQILEFPRCVIRLEPMHPREIKEVTVDRLDPPIQPSS